VSTTENGKPLMLRLSLGQRNAGGTSEALTGEKRKTPPSKDSVKLKKKDSMKKVWPSLF
jgi:hypothetical protein